MYMDVCVYNIFKTKFSKNTSKIIKCTDILNKKIYFSIYFKNMLPWQHTWECPF